nr:hypothetical protein [Tanacetum cinerariifolium]
MAPVMFADTHNVVAYLSKSDVSEDFDQIMDFLNAHTIKYALVLRALIDGKKVVVSEAIIRRDLHLDDANGVECLPNEEIFAELVRMGYEKPPPKLTFYKVFFSMQWKFLIHTLVQCLSAKRTAWNEFSCFMASAVIYLATGRKFNFSKYIFDSMVRNVDSPSKFLIYPRFLQVVMDNQVDDLTSHNTRYTSPALTHKVFVNMHRVEKGFSGVETPLFASMLVLQQPQAKVEEEEVEIPIASSPPALQDPTIAPHTTPPQDQPSTPHASPPHEQPTTTSKSFMSLLTTLMETCATLSQKVAELEQDNYSQALEILQLKKRVKKLEKKMRSKSSGFKRLRRVEAIDADEGHTLIKLKAKKAKLLNEQIAQKLHDEEVQKAVARDKQEKDDMERAQEIHTEGSRTYWKIIRVEGITEAYQSFEDMLKGFNREDLVALWSLVKEKSSSAVPSVDKKKALWVELKILFEPNIGSLKKSKKRSLEDLKPREQDTRRTSGNTTSAPTPL